MLGDGLHRLFCMYHTIKGLDMSCIFVTKSYTCNETGCCDEKLDLIYLCTVIGNLTGMPIRLFHGENLVFKLVMDVSNDTQYHPSDPIATGTIAQSLFISRPYLSRKFKIERKVSQQ